MRHQVFPILQRGLYIPYLDFQPQKQATVGH
ncbi:hypothetical protein T06_12177 [Trichinella sp. T6]|nr:hypothetical protein T06_12177 [Trichinella sp. T6]